MNAALTLVVGDSPLGNSILIDTCFFLDANFHPNVFGSYVDKLKKDENDLLTIGPVKLEFIRTKSKADLFKKQEYINRVVDTMLPIDLEVDRVALGLMSEYGADLDGVSVVDIYLAACLKRYRGLLLFTRNHTDFPTHLFERVSLYNFNLPKNVNTYAFYRYKNKNKEFEVKTEEMPF